DMIKLPNGNVLAIMTAEKTAAEMTAAGRKGNRPLMLESIIELKPKGKDGAEIVWEWHVWDHLIQDQDAAKPKHGKIEEHPERININFGAKDNEKDNPLGDLGARLGRAAFGVPEGDWTHFNGLSYNADLNQLMVSVHGFSEFWIIDHSTTTAEA